MPDLFCILLLDVLLLITADSRGQACYVVQSALITLEI